MIRERSVTAVAHHLNRHVALASGVRLHVLEWSPSEPTGEAIVMVHGLASNATLWQGAAASLMSLGHHAVAIDQRGHGRSDKPDDGYDMATVADDLAHFIELLRDGGMPTPVVAGQSWGGNVAIELAHRRPDLIRGVVAVDGGFLELREHFPDWEQCASALRPPNLLGTHVDEFRRWIRDAHPDWPESGIDATVNNMEVLADSTIRPWLSLDRHLQVLRGLWEHQPTKLYPHIEVPVLFVPAEGEGGIFTATKRKALERATALLPASKVEWFSPADHDLHAQFPERFARVVHDAIVGGFFR